MHHAPATCVAVAAPVAAAAAAVPERGGTRASTTAARGRCTTSTTRYFDMNTTININKMRCTMHLRPASLSLPLLLLLLLLLLLRLLLLLLLLRQLKLILLLFLNANGYIRAAAVASAADTPLLCYGQSTGTTADTHVQVQAHFFCQLLNNKQV